MLKKDGPFTAACEGLAYLRRIGKAAFSGLKKVVSAEVAARGFKFKVHFCASDYAHNRLRATLYAHI